MTVADSGPIESDFYSETYLLDLSDTTATAGTDFKISSAGQTLSSPYRLPSPLDGESLAFSITGIDDSMVDPEELINVDVVKHWRTSIPDGLGGISHHIRDSATLISLVVTIEDDDADLEFDRSSVSVDEGDTASYKVKLSAEPTAGVTVSVTSSGSAATVSPSSLSFTTSNWDTWKTVRVTALSRSTVGNVSLSVNHVASGGGYGDVSEAMPVTVVGPDPELVFDSSDVEVDEGGTGSYRVKLSAEPTAGVTVSVTSSGSAATVSSSSLSFTTSNWDDWQTVRVTALSRSTVGNVSLSVNHVASGGGYGDVSEAMPVTVIGPDPELVFDSSDVEVDEGDTASYRVKLSAEPTAGVTVSVTSSGSAATVSPGSLSFTTSNWDTWKTVRVTALSRSTVGNISLSVNHVASGGGYGDVSEAMPVTVVGPPAELEFDRSSVSVDEGGTGSYRVKLSAEPTAGVTVSVTSSGSAATVSPSSLSFTTSNWDTWKTVRVTALSRSTVGNVSLSVNHVASGGGYGDVSEAMPVTVIGPDPELVFDSSDVEVDEGDTASYKVKLSAEPTVGVTVTVTSSDTAAATVSSSSLSFTASNWDTWKTVTVTALSRSTVGNVSLSVNHVASGGGYGDVSEAMPVTVVGPDPELVFDSSDVEVDEGGTGSYRVRLSAQPTATVRVGLTSSDRSAATVSPSSLSFTTSNWDDWQTVRATALSRSTVGNVSLSVNHVASGGGYGDVSEAMPVTVVGPDPELVFDSSDVEVDEGDTASYKVKLSAEPTAGVTVTVTSSDTAAATVSPGSLSFTTSNWDTWKTVRVTALSRSTVGNISLSVNHVASGGGYGDVSEAMPVTVVGLVPGLEIDLSYLGLNEGGTGSYRVRLSAQPTATVRVGLTSSDRSAATVSPSSLTFSTTDWDDWQTVEVTASSRPVVGDVAVPVMHEASGGGYDGVSKTFDLAVLGPNAQLEFNPRSLTVVKGSTGSYEVRLEGRPTATVRVGLTSSDTSAATVSPSRLTFSTTDWDDWQTVEVTASSRSVVGNDTVVVYHETRGGGYDGVRSTLVVTVVGPDPELVFDSSDVEVDEGDTASYKVKLSAEPTAGVTVSVTSSGSAATVSPGSLSFTTSNWDTWKTVRVTALSRSTVGNISLSVNHVASGGGYGDVSEAMPVTVVGLVPGLEIDLSYLGLNEGGTGSYRVRLSAQPTATVRVGLTSSDRSAATVSPSSLTFSTTDWDDWQTVEVTASSRPVVGDVAVPVMHEASGGGYDGVSKTFDLAVLGPNAQLEFNPRSLTVVKGSTGSYEVRLEGRPTATVRVGLTSSDTSAATVSPSRLTFSTTDWDDWQTVEVTASSRSVVGNDTVVVYHETRGGGYDGVRSTLVVTVVGPDPELVFDSSDVEVDEGDTASYKVKLSAEPTAGVTVTVTSSDTAAATVSSSSLSFTASNWDTWKTVTVTALSRSTVGNVSLSVNHVASGGGYGDVSEAMPVTVVGPDPELVFDSSDVEVDEGGTGSYRVRLSAQPTATVRVGLTSSDRSAATVSPSSLSFTTSNWDDWQTVRVTALSRSTVGNVSLSVNHVASGGGYGDVSEAMPVTVVGPDPELVFDSSDVEVDEGDTASYKVKLSAEPTAGVTVTVTSSDTAAATVSPGSLSFTTSNWNTWKTVRVTGVVDADGVDEEVTLSHSASNGGYGGVTAELDVTVVEVDSPPMFWEAVVIGLTLTMTYDEALDGSSVPAPDAFSVTVSGSAQTPSGVSVSGRTAVLTLSSAASYGDMVTVSYTVPQSDPIQDAEGNDSVGLADEEVVNLTPLPAVTVSFSAEFYTAEEGGDAAQVSVTLSDYPLRPVVIDLVSSPQDNTTPQGEPGGDYSGIPARVRFAANQNSKTFEVEATDDDMDDNGERVNLSFGDSLPAGVTASGQTTSRVDLIDNDVRGVDVSKESLELDEGGSDEYTVVLTSQPVGGDDVTVTVIGNRDVTLNGGAAGADLALTFTDADWSTAQTVTVAAFDDNVAEGEEQVTLEHKVIGYGPVTSGDAVTVTITDNDAPGTEVTLTVIPAEVGESAGQTPLAVTATLSGSAFVQAKDITVSVSPGTAADGTDYTASAAVLTIPAEQTSGEALLTITPRIDQVVERDETVRIVGLLEGLTVNAAEVTITDKTVPLWSVAVDPAAIAEADGASTVTVSTGEVTFVEPQVVSLALSGTAAGSDYEVSRDGQSLASPYELTLPAGTASVTAIVSALDDSEAEADETIVVAAVHEGVQRASATITIEDDEIPPTGVTLEVAPASVGESAGATTVAVTGTLNGAALPEATVVTVTVSPDTALADDFAAVADFALTIDAGEIAGTATFSLTPADDFMDEEDEAVSVTGASSDLAVTGTSVIIEDNDVRGVTITPTSFSVDEGDTVVDAYSVVLTSQPVVPGPGQPADVTVTIEGHAGTDLVLDDDPARPPLMLTFTAGNWDTAQEVTVTAGEDDDYLDDEATLTHTPAGGGYDGVTADDVTVAVDDNDSNEYTARFDSATISVEEGESAEVTLRIKATLEPAEVVRYRVATHNGTADWFQGDYPPVLPRLEEALAEDFALQSDGSYLYQRVFELRTLEDSEVEADETFYFDIVRLADPSGGEYSTVIEGHEDGVAITITDDDQPTSVILTVSSAVVAEAAGSTSLTVTGTLSGAARSQDTALALSVSPGPDTETADFTATVGTLTIVAGDTSGEAMITLTPFDDNLVEGAETVLVGGAAADLTVTGASVTVTDDDVPVWAVSVDPSSIGEAVGSAALTVSTGGVAYEDNQAIGLAYSGTATPTSDYTAPGSLTLMAEDLSVEGTVAAVADTVADTDETVIVAASHGGVDIGTVTVTITEGICGRTGRVRRALVAAVQANDSGVAGCGDVTAAHLSAIAELDLSDRDLSMLSAGDFAGLSGLEGLNLKKAQLGALPEGVFAGLSSLVRLRLQENGLGSLPMGVFAGLTALSDLQLDKNGISALSADVFSGLSSLATIDLSDNSLTALPSGVFSGLSSLSDLNLKDNDLQSLPDGLFSGLDGLSRLRLDGNGSDPLPIAVSLEKVGADQFKVVVPAGAPFGFAVPVTVSSGGEIGVGTVAMAAGSVEGAPLRVIRAAGTVDAVTVDMGVLPGLPSDHRGYVLERDAALPLDVLPRVLSTDATLSTLTLSEGTLDPAFSSATTSYTASVVHTVSSVTVTPQTSHGSATVEYYDAGDAAIEDADGYTAGHQVALGVGENTVKVKVTAEDGATSETYTVIVTRADEAMVSITAAATPVIEGSPAEFTLTRTGPSDFALTVLVQVSQDGAVLLNAAEYTSATEVTFALGETTHTLSAATENDTVDEALSSEPGTAGRVTAALQPGAGYAAVADSSSAEIAVEDDDAPVWSVAVSPAEISEAGGASILTVSTGGVVTFAEDQTLSLTTSGTATAGDDFTLASSLTLTAGLTSATATLAAISDGVAEAAETANIAVNHGGAQVGTATVTISDGICGRTRKVRNAILGRLPGVDDCAAVTATQLSGIRGKLNLANMTIGALEAGDFAGLSRLEALDLKGNGLDEDDLPAGIFDDLTALTTLRLQQNTLTDLPARVFAGLTELTDLQLDGNQLAGLEAGDFAGLSKLETLDLEGNQLSALQSGAFDGLGALTILRLQNNRLVDVPVGLFDGLTQLTELNLRNNRFRSLPARVFAGLAAVTTLKIDRNPIDPLPLIVGLEKVGEDQFKAVVPAGAPFAIELPVSVSSGGAIADGATRLTIAAGAVESAELSVTREMGATDAVTATIGVLPEDQPASHVGYALRKSADLPLDVLAEAPALPVLSVADPAAVEEAQGGDTTITFEVTLTGTVTGTVTVEYATKDGTALARDALNPNGDYLAASGTLTFTDPQRTQSVDVTIYADAFDEQQETFKLKLSNPSGATITDGEAIGTITNSGPLPRAWLVRFGRTVAGHVTEGIGDRLVQSDRVRPQATLAGVRLPFGEEALHASNEPGLRGQAGAFGRGWTSDGTLGWGSDRSVSASGWGDAPIGSARALTSRDLLLGSSFVIHLGGGSGADAGMGWTVWGRGMATRFDGSEEDLKLDGEVATYLLGADTVRGRWLGGVVLAHSRGDGGYDAAIGAFERGELASTLTSVHPYVRFTVSERMTAWGALGYGRGGLLLDRGAAGTWATDTAMRMGTAGARGVLKPAALTGGFELAVRSDALYTRMTSGGAENEAGRLAGSEGSASRLRLILEGARTLTLGHRTLTPNLELGLRHDAGDAETGTGIEVGGGLGFADPTLGLSLEVKARSLITHQDADYREWGASAAIRFNPGATGSGLLLTLTPSWGVAPSGVERLWSQRDARGLAGYGGLSPAGRLGAEVGYALSGPRGLGTQLPYAAISLGDTGGRTLRVGWRLTMGPRGNLHLEAMRQQSTNGNSAENGILMRAAVRW